MKEQVIKLIGNSLDELGLYVYDVYQEGKGNVKSLYIVLDNDSEDLIDLETVVKATDIINPIIDKSGLADNIDVLDIYAKEKGEL